CLAAITRFVEAAVRRIAPQRARHRGVNCIAVSRINHDSRDTLRFLQASPRPRFTAIGRLIDSVANGNAVARPRLTASDPHIFRIFRIERDGADRLTALVVEYRAVPRPTIIRFPNPSAGRANKERNLPGRLTYTRDA